MTGTASTSPNDPLHEKVVIIGAGAAGLTAGIYTARANLSPVIIAGLQPGGSCTFWRTKRGLPIVIPFCVLCKEVLSSSLAHLLRVAGFGKSAAAAHWRG